MKHCPLCGRGISAKYRVGQHVRYLRPKYRKHAKPESRRLPCPFIL